ncbi:oxysterol-binding protein-related protein 9-like isoform X2 [Oscarella lobularis]|uniref:oxysterol-binding protein-related protein 9-like isoform X2 n=1 Tax=Oscarella lobularis TaxID=121494 RepID=UPI003313BF72
MTSNQGLEGPLSKWTNVVQGWQYRWFVLDRDSGLLSYYTSKEKMMKGSRRGCLRLRGAIIGIDDEDDSTFTISCDHKTFHFQARDTQERDEWIASLEEAISHHAQPFERASAASPHSMDAVSPIDVERRLLEATGYHKLLVEQIAKLQARIGRMGAELGDRVQIFSETSQGMIDTMKECLDMMQYAKSNNEKRLHSGKVRNANEILTLEPDGEQKQDHGQVPAQQVSSEGVTESSSPRIIRSSSSTCREAEPVASYSSEEEDEFYDANESVGEEETVETNINESDSKTKARTASQECVEEDPSQSDDDDGDVGSDRTVISYLLSQVRIGMDLTRITLPTFILEKRSLLEMYADFFAHPDVFSSIPDLPSPKDRMISLVRWYLSAFHAGRKAAVAKKPYNPVLGEMFECFWKLGGDDSAGDDVEIVSSGPVPWCGNNSLSYIAEQVSHHPPVSAFYAENVQKKIQINAHIYTKSKFLGLAIGVHNIGQGIYIETCSANDQCAFLACIKLLDLDEDYVLTFPNGYGRSILTVPWMELGGKVSVLCKKTGYSAAIEFHCKPFYGGKKHRISGEITHTSSGKKPLVKLDGEWNSVIRAKYEGGESEVFVDTRIIPIWRKRVRATLVQADNESRKLWKDVTVNLKAKKIDPATSAKHKIEEKQRAEAKERKATGEEWKQRFFHLEDGVWIYNNPLEKRLSGGD